MKALLAVDQIKIEHETYHLVLKRRRGARLYTNNDRSKYLRIGQVEMIKNEFNFHRQLLQYGFPVARILSHGIWDGYSYWIEESLGNASLLEIFREDFRNHQTITNDHFTIFLHHAKSTLIAQCQASNIPTPPLHHLAQATSIVDMEAELPSWRGKIQEAWKKAEITLRNIPFCPTHGDFNAANIFEKGIIDFGDHFEGPVGYDIVTAITTPFWFPEDSSFEYVGGYAFSSEHIDTFLHECGTLKTPNGILNLRDIFDALFFIRSNWWSARNHKMPRIQAWRYHLYQEILERYLQGDSLFAYWQNTGRS